MTQCTEPDIINQSKAIASALQYPGLFWPPLAKGLLSCTLLMELKLNVPLFLHRWTQGVCLLLTLRVVVSGEGEGEGSMG